MKKFPSAYFPQRPQKKKTADDEDQPYTQEQLESIQELADTPGWRLILETVILARVDYLRARALTKKMTTEAHAALIDQLAEIRTMLEAVYVPVIGEIPESILARFF